jgi:predicted regulator of Ras-like GTPase activity (Roadblock/LC7/MglB family)
VSPRVRQVPDLNGLITTFVERVASVAHAIVVSSDGLPMAFSRGFPPDRADQLAAVTSGLASLTQGASRVFEGGVVNQTVVEMQRGVLIMMAISDGSSLAVLAAPECDMGLVAYEMVLLVEQVGSALTPGTHSGQPPGWPGLSGSAVNGNGGAGETEIPGA